MIIRKAYKFRLKPSEEQTILFEQFAGCCRFVWNKVLKMSLDRLKNNQKIIWYHEADFWSRIWKKSDEYSFLKTCHSHPIQQKLRDLDKAFRDGFDKNQPNKRLPIFRKKGLHDSFRYPSPKQFKIDNRRIFLPKVGWVGFFKSQDIVGKPCNITISKHGGDWYCSIQVELEISPEQNSQAKTALGLDLGIAKFAACFDGSYIEPINAPKVQQQKLAKAQRALSKKKRFSNNWKKVKLKIQKIHSKIGNVRLDFLHKLSTKLCKSHAMIVVEALKIKNMSKSAKGDLDNPGKNVKAKSGLNKSILDQGWGIFKTLLKYKLEWCGSIFLEVNPKYTSQKCSKCGYTDKENRPNQEEFGCLDCGAKLNADLNAAKNILAAGLAVLACGEDALASPVKQEPMGIGDLVPS